MFCCAYVDIFLSQECMIDIPFKIVRRLSWIESSTHYWKFVNKLLKYSSSFKFDIYRSYRPRLEIKLLSILWRSKKMVNVCIYFCWRYNCDVNNNFLFLIRKCVLVNIMYEKNLWKKYKIIMNLFCLHFSLIFIASVVNDCPMAIIKIYSITNCWSS